MRRDNNDDDDDDDDDDNDDDECDDNDDEAESFSACLIFADFLLASGLGDDAILVSVGPLIALYTG